MTAINIYTDADKRLFVSRLNMSVHADFFGMTHPMFLIKPLTLNDI